MRLKSGWMFWPIAATIRLIPHIVWQNLHPRLPADAERLLSLVESYNIETSPGLARCCPASLKNSKTQSNHGRNEEPAG